LVLPFIFACCGRFEDLQPCFLFRVWCWRLSLPLEVGFVVGFACCNPVFCLGFAFRVCYLKVLFGGSRPL
jgi:hypothetical protein